jgi:S1-C subfamily serine protease
MLRSLVVVVGLLGTITTSRAGDTIPQKVVQAVKNATVYIQVEAADWDKSGSGFVVAADGGTVLVVTNRHVVMTLPRDVASTKPAAIKVVFGSGTKAERSYPAEVVASDAERDLAVLKAIGVKDAPEPISYANPDDAVETLVVYSFGFPFGQALATGKGFPAITVGKASVSSLRTGNDGELATIQIDGNLNPGNSGGPVVDSKGRLVGVAVAIQRDGQGIGFLVPAAEVVRTMEGRFGRVRVSVQKGAEGKPTVRVEADVIDPLGALRGAIAYYVVVPSKGKKPDTTALDKHPSARKLGLKLEMGVAAAEFAAEKAEGEVLVQVVAERLPGKQVVATRVRGFSLSPPPRPGDFAGPPPDGWTDYAPQDKSFAVWLPAQPVQQAEKQRNVSVNGQVMRVNSIVGKTADGLIYLAESVALPANLARNPPVRLHALVRSALLDEGRGRFTESVEVKSGSLSGVQYRIAFGDEIARARVFIGRSGLVRLVRVMGTADQVATPEAETILQSFRLPRDEFAAKTPEVGGGNFESPKSVYRGKVPFILGSIRDPIFKTVGPAGAVLIGLEAKFTKFGAHDIVRAVRPIYRAGGMEVLGPLTGADLTGAVMLKARDGYAVGAISGKANWWCHGFSLTYMKVNVDGTLDPKDSYESDWVGWNGKMDTTRSSGDGAPAVGLVGKIVGQDTTALGLLFKGQEGFDPNAPSGGDQQVRSVPMGKEPSILGSIRDPEFKTVGPPGAVLIGLEAKFNKFGAHDIVRAVRPIYRVGGNEEFGEQFGNNLTGAVTLKAKDGYAVGAISGKANLWCHGFSLTYMKLKVDGTLDPKDAYESEWVGWNGSMAVTRVGGDGTPVVGIVGKIVRTETTALGLLFKGQENFIPSRGR